MTRSTDAGAASPLGLFADAIEQVAAGRPVDGLALRAQLTHLGDQLRALGADAGPSLAGFEAMAGLCDRLEAAVVHVEAGDAEQGHAAMWEALRGSFGRETRHG